MAYISFRFLDLTGQITGGLIKNIGELGRILPGGEGMMFVLGAIMGVGMICLFPVHWALFYYPGDVMLLIAIILPWILCCTITSGLMAHSPKGGFNTSIAIGLGYFFAMLLPYIVMGAVLGSALGAPGLGTALMDAVASGLTDLPYVLAVLLATMEGAAVGGVFGAFVGSLKYEPEGAVGKTKKERSKSAGPEPTFDRSSSSAVSPASEAKRCSNCGAKLETSDEFCTNCGSKN